MKAFPDALPEIPDNYREVLSQAAGDGNPDSVFVIGIQTLVDKVATARKMEAVRAGRTKKGKSRSAAALRRCGNAARVVELESPPSDRDGQIYKILVMCRASGVFFSPPWSLPDGDIYQRQRRSGSQRRLRKGVTFEKGTGRHFFRYEYLVEISEELRDIRIREWLSEHSQLSPAGFRKLRDQHSQQAAHAAKAAAGKGLQGIRFQKEHDDAITRLYRPGMTEDDEQELLGICAGRNWRAIRDRAATLTRERLEQGVFDERRLPHRNFSSRLNAQIRKNRRKAGLED